MLEALDSLLFGQLRASGLGKEFASIADVMAVGLERERAPGRTLGGGREIGGNRMSTLSRFVRSL